jgi:hypothetical protein
VPCFDRKLAVHSMDTPGRGTRTGVEIPGADALRPFAKLSRAASSFRKILAYSLPAIETSRAHTWTMERFKPSVDRLALLVFEQAQRTGELVTMDLVNHVVNELFAHPAECRCGACQAAAQASARAIFRTAQAWECSVGVTRRLARA